LPKRRKSLSPERSISLRERREWRVSRTRIPGSEGASGSVSTAARKKRVDTKIAVIEYLEDLIRKLRDEAVKEM